jgi:hypothetical protein
MKIHTILNFSHIDQLRSSTTTRYRTVGMGTRHWLEGRSSISAWDKIFFCFPQRPGRVWNPPSLTSNGITGALCPRVKWPGREADHSPTSSAEVNNDEWSYTSISPTLKDINALFRAYHTSIFSFSVKFCMRDNCMLLVRHCDF